MQMDHILDKFMVQYVVRMDFPFFFLSRFDGKFIKTSKSEFARMDERI